jgi:branched-chain amino acid transport system substrate-binding protein
LAWDIVLATESIAVGLLFSTEGPYAAIGREGLAGASLAIKEINATAEYSFTLRAEHRDPAGATERYAKLAHELIASAGARHIIGCTTSWSRKEVIPVLEKHGAMLWYPCPYEGFECNEQVVYLGACPNQHILPLLDYILPRFGREIYLVGSNYIWGWETNRIAREIVEQSSGMVAGERYITLGDADIAHIIDDIRLKRPAFILNTLIGPSCYAFLGAYHALGTTDPDFRMDKRPVISCNLAESEAAALGDVAAGLFTIAPYFQTLRTEFNEQFLDRAREHDALGSPVSAFFVHAYAAVHLLASGLARSSDQDSGIVLKAATELPTPSPLGPLQISANNNHAVLAPHIARLEADGRLNVIVQRTEAIAPDPYLAHSRLTLGAAEQPRSDAQSFLRVIK